MIKQTHRRKKMYIWGAALLTAMLFLVSACGGGGGGGTGGDDAATPGDVSPLSLPDRIQLSKVADDVGGARATQWTRGAYSDAGTDYTNAVKRSWVKDTDALNMINTVLGVCAETGYDNFINQGPYKALVRDKDANRQGQSGNSTTSTTIESLMEIIVDVTRASNSDPMIIKIWLVVEGPDDQPMLVRGHFTVTQGVGAEYPYGAMIAHFRGDMLNDDGSLGTEMLKMSLSVDAQDGHVIIENIQDEGIVGEWEMYNRVRVVTNADVTEGNAYVSNRESQDDGQGNTVLPEEPTIMQIAFNAEYFKASEEGAADIVYAKDQLHHRVYQYQLFEADSGNRITNFSGFPIEFDSANGTRNGYVGYYGLWTNNGDTLNHGDTVRDMHGAAYTVFKSVGKLTKHIRSSMPLDELTGVELAKWTDGEDIIVAWNGTNFWKIGYRDPTNGQTAYFSDTDPAYHENVTFAEWEGAWCEALKAYLRLGSLYGAGMPDNDSEVSFHSEQTVGADEAQDLTLYTWSFSLNMPIDQNVIDAAADDEMNYWGSNPVKKTFQFAASEMMLYDESGTYPALLPDDASIPNNSNLQWGYRIGPLTTEQYSEQTWWQANEAVVYYTWSTGADQWNQYVTVQDAQGEFASFDPPISFTYIHTTANDVNADNTYDNRTFRLEYDGYSLNLPWAYDDLSDEWAPLLNIADGTLMGTNGNEYVIKGIEESLIMSEVDDPSGVIFDNEEEVGAPTLEYDASKTALVGDVPNDVTVKVIKGNLIE